MSPGSPSQTMAALFPRPSRTWRSTQFSQALSLPPRNHFAWGGFHCRTRRQGFRQRSRRASFSQWRRRAASPFGKAEAARTRAWADHHFGGG